MNDKLINLKTLFTLINIEPFFLLSGLLLVAWGFYKVLLHDASPERHKTIRGHFKNLLRHYSVFLILFVAFMIIRQAKDHPDLAIYRAIPYVGLATYFWGLVIFVKSCRLIVLQYLFLGSMKHGVPLLLVNIFSLLLSIVLLLWTMSNIFGLQVTPVLATSAAFSIILGLALQDTLGNLFAGISLQVDKTFEIGDWLEIAQGNQKIVGQVKEITWRATVLTGWTEELITVPNRMMANAQVANFSSNETPIYRSQVFKVQHGVDVVKAKRVLIESLKDITLIRRWPEPACIITETTENWIALKLIYSLDNYGSQFSAGDQVVEAGLKALHDNAITIAAPRLKILGRPSTVN